MLPIPRLFSERMKMGSVQTWNALSKHNQRWQDEDEYIYSQMENKSEWQRERKSDLRESMREPSERPRDEEGEQRAALCMN